MKKVLVVLLCLALVTCCEGSHGGNPMRYKLTTYDCKGDDKKDICLLVSGPGTYLTIPPERLTEKESEIFKALRDKPGIVLIYPDGFIERTTSEY